MFRNLFTFFTIPQLLDRMSFDSMEQICCVRAEWEKLSEIWMNQKFLLCVDGIEFREFLLSRVLRVGWEISALKIVIETFSNKQTSRASSRRDRVKMMMMLCACDLFKLLNLRCRWEQARCSAEMADFSVEHVERVVGTGSFQRRDRPRSSV